MKTTHFLKLALLVSILSFFSCASNKKDDPVPSNSGCSSCATCSDGIKNQDETGIDCGGSCSPCDFVCDGNGENKYYPLNTNFVWKYNNDTDTAVDYEIKVLSKSTSGSDNIFEIKYDEYISNYTYYVRRDNQGDIYTHDTSYPSDPGRLILPANPALNQTWPGYPPYYHKVVSLNATLTTPVCTYTNCLQVDEFDASNNPTGIKSYYVKGIGLVSDYFMVSRDLIDAELY